MTKLSIKGLTLRRIEQGVDSEVLQTHINAFDSLPTPESNNTAELSDEANILFPFIRKILFNILFDEEFDFSSDENKKAVIFILSEKERIEKEYKQYFLSSIFTEKVVELDRTIERKNAYAFISKKYVSSLVRILNNLSYEASNNFDFDGAIENKSTNNVIEEITNLFKENLTASQMAFPNRRLDALMKKLFLQYTISSFDSEELSPSSMSNYVIEQENIQKEVVKAVTSSVIERIFDEDFSEEDKVSSLLLESFDKSSNLESQIIQDAKIKSFSAQFSLVDDEADAFTTIDLIESNENFSVENLFLDIKNLTLSYVKGEEDGIIITYLIENAETKEVFDTVKIFAEDSADLAVYDALEEVSFSDEVISVSMNFERVWVTENPDYNPELASENHLPWIFTVIDESLSNPGYLTVTYENINTDKFYNQDSMKVLLTTESSIKYLSENDFFEETVIETS